MTRSRSGLLLALLTLALSYRRVPAFSSLSSSSVTAHPSSRAVGAGGATRSGPSSAPRAPPCSSSCADDDDGWDGGDAPPPPPRLASDPRRRRSHRRRPPAAAAARGGGRRRRRDVLSSLSSSTIGVVAAALLLPLPRPADAGLLDDYGADPGVDNGAAAKKTKEMARDRGKPESNVEPNLRSNYYYPTNKGECFPPPPARLVSLVCRQVYFSFRAMSSSRPHSPISSFLPLAPI
jgi:hypothetical protein